MFLNAFKRITSAGVPSLQLVRRLDVITADGGGLYQDGSALAAAELTYIDGITAIGTAQASKAVVLDANKGVVGLGVTSVGTSNTSGVVLTSSVTNALQVVAEDNGVAVTSGNIKAIKGRLFLKANAGDITADGILGQVKVNTSITCSADYTNGIRGYLELVGGNTVNTGGANANTGCGGIGVHGWISVADDLTIATGHYLCGVASRLSVDTGKVVTTTGVLAAYGVFADDNLGGATPTQVWGYGLYVPNGVVTTGAYIGTATTGINLAGTYTTGIAIEAATSSITFGTGDGKIVDAASSLSIYGGNTNGDALVLFGSSADANQKITITGASGTAVTGTLSTTDTISMSYANPSAAYNGLYSAITAANTWSGSLAGVRSTLTSSATAGIGNAYAGRFELIQSGLPSSQGHTAALYAQTTVTGGTNNPTSVFTATLAGASGGTTTPFILFQDASTDKSTILFSVGSAGNLMGTTSGKIYYNETLRILANASARFIPLSTTEGTYTTAYPISFTSTLDGVATNPSSAVDVAHFVVNAANTWSGSVVGVRSTVTSSATAGIGNMYGGRFELIQSALPSSQGHTCALMAQTTVTGATNNPTSILTLTLDGVTGGQTTPFILFQDHSTEKSTILFSVGSTGNTVGTASGDIYYNEGLRILVNTAARYIPLSTTEGTYTTAYPIITTKTNASAAYNQIYVSGSESATWSGSITGIRCTMTSSATAGIGNMYAGRFELAQSAAPSSQGHTTALYVQTTCTGATNNPTSVASFVLAGESGGNTTPFLNFIDASTDKTLYFFEAGTGGALAESTDATACFDTGINLANTAEITHGLRVKVNGADYYVLLAVAATVAT